MEMQWYEAVIIVVIPLILALIAIYLDYYFWKRRVPKKNEAEEGIRYYPNLNLGKLMVFTGVCTAILYLIIRLMPLFLKEPHCWQDVTLRLGILAFVGTILAILANTIKED